MERGEILAFRGARNEIGENKGGKKERRRKDRFATLPSPRFGDFSCSTLLFGNDGTLRL
jgi:hypothetical protein